MGRKKKSETIEPALSIQEISAQNQKFSDELNDELANNPEFSLAVDPLNKYSMSEEQKTFIKHYCEFKSIPMAAELSNIDLNTAKSYFVAYSSQQEIRRINKAMYQRQFSSKLLSIDEIASWLSSLITDDGVPMADRVKTMDKVRIAQMLIDLQVYKNQAINDPSNIIDVDIESEIKDLSVESIKSLLSQKNSKKEDEKKKEGIQAIKDSYDVPLSPEEEAFLKTLPAKDILKLLNDSSKEEQKGGKND